MTMTFDIEPFRSAIEAICRRFEVERLDITGSAARDDFDPATSDVDFLVLFHSEGTLRADERYFGLQTALQSTLATNVDLIDIRSARNPYLIASALRTRRPLYAA